MILFGPARIIKKRCAELQPQLYRLAWSWCRDADIAQDLVQETWAKALERSSQLRDQERLLQWMTRIMVNTYRDHQRRRHDDLNLDQVEIPGDDATSENLDRHDDIRRVQQAVSQLPDEQRLVLTLVDLMGFSYAEVADTLELPIGTVMSRLSRSRQKLREFLTVDNDERRHMELRRVK
ncbi:MAG: sigma-70 family RNA polymerase sigma factor [Candidatus Thiodiazotropha sp.]|nr:sigma-70 family RNA polymerase sigma factor [Candidatus Thiodiazotropha taylori]MBT3061072.1 sigma-70 family RNA polymerase sigma factor [Candidatus Thiodiazotropha sp. (ex Lucina pensylvanica)]MBV2096027.1 sigma-70 family RNA polymerase sigma factor [Candidatus Thiodiazotropha sp. (ex Codakia orbicularis)]